MNYICFNGKILPGSDPILVASNRSYRYGDGFFETMKVIVGNIRLESFHMERLFGSLELLQYEIPALFTVENIRTAIVNLCERNNCTALARARLSLSRGNGGLYDADKKPQYIIEAWPLDPAVNRLNENGLVIGIYPDARKSTDIFSTIKSASALPYSLAALFAKEHHLNDCLLLNMQGNIADSTIANLFILKNDRLLTPPLEEGCINGVMRRKLLAESSLLKTLGVEISEQAISVNDVRDADEIFLTNAINGMRWVKEFEKHIYTNQRTVEIFQALDKTF